MQKIQKNIGPFNRLGRGILGIVLLFVAFYSSNWLAFTIFLLLGAIAIGEAFSGHCIYHHLRKTKDMR